MSDPIKTPCYCPDTPHEHDEFFLCDELPMAAGLAAAMSNGQLDGIVPALLRNGAIASWNLVDSEGKPLPITPENVDRRLTWSKAVDFLNEALPRLIAMVNPGPLVSTVSAKKSGKPSRSGRTDTLTSVKTSSSAEPLEPSE